jgi:hypothetical protein
VRVLLASALVGGEWSASRLCRFTPGAHWIGVWVGPRAVWTTWRSEILDLTGPFCLAAPIPTALPRLWTGMKRDRRGGSELGNKCCLFWPVLWTRHARGTCHFLQRFQANCGKASSLEIYRPRCFYFRPTRLQSSAVVRTTQRGNLM